MRHVMKGVAFAATLLAISAAPAQSSLRSERHCVRAACFTIPQVKDNALTAFKPQVVAVQNFFSSGKKKGFLCKQIGIICDYTGASGFTSYMVAAVPAPVGQVWREALKSDYCKKKRSRTTYLMVDSKRARSVTCRMTYKKLTFLARMVAWRHNNRTYFVELVRSGKHPPAKWDTMLRSFNLREA